MKNGCNVKKQGISGHLSGEKVSEDIARTRMILTRTDALSSATNMTSTLRGS